MVESHVLAPRQDPSRGWKGRNHRRPEENVTCRVTHPTRKRHDYILSMDHSMAFALIPYEICVQFSSIILGSAFLCMVLFHVSSQVPLCGESCVLLSAIHQLRNRASQSQCDCPPTLLRWWFPPNRSKSPRESGMAPRAQLIGSLVARWPPWDSPLPGSVWSAAAVATRWWWHATVGSSPVCRRSHPNTPPPGGRDDGAPPERCHRRRSRPTAVAATPIG